MAKRPDSSASSGSIAEQILASSRRRVRKHFEDADFRDANIALRNTTEHVAREYHGRVVLELVQNAHDALPKARSDGRILVRLDEGQGEFGTLYVANSGNPFTQSNFEAIRKVAVSDKPPEEAIGNKGIGFKSVLEVCDSPAIYSTARPSSGQYDGFCFRFPRPEDLGVLVDDPADAAQLADEMLLLGLPIPAVPDSAALEGLADQGLVTVVALPLRNEAAREGVREQLEALVDDEAPVLLFLERVRELRVEGLADEEESIVLTRSAKRLPKGRCRRVDLGHLGDYVVATRPVAGDALAEALEASMELRLIDRRFADWQGDTEVAAAVRIDEPLAVGRRFTHLPMGPDAESPAAAHLDAPFYANIARTDAVEDVPFNARLMDELAHCCLAAALELRGRPERWAPGAAVDFLAWDDDHVERWEQAAEAAGIDPRREPLFPSLTASGLGWAGLEGLRRWPDLSEGADHVLTAAAIAGAGATLMWPDLGEERLDRLEALAWSVADGAEPEDEQVAEWVEQVALTLHQQRFDPRRWESFYDDLAELGRDAEALGGRRLLLTGEDELRPAGQKRKGRGRRTASVTFFNPADDDESPVLLDVPPRLRKEIAFMHRGIDWNLRDGHVRKRPGREYLEQAGLVQEYRTDGVRTALRQLLDRSKDKALHADALRFTFNLFRSLPADKRGAFRQVSFRVPSASGKLIAASDAIFSPGWGTPAGRLVSDLVDRCSPASEQIADLAARMMGEPPDDASPLPEWVEFLTAIGVTDGLPPIPLKLLSSVEGRYAEDRHWLGVEMGLTEVDAQYWHDDCADQEIGGLKPYTAYRFEAPPVVIPGQGDVAAFDDRAKELFAELAVLGLASWPDTALQCVLQKSSNAGQEPRTLPTPLASFLRYAPWVPVAEPGQREALTFVPPAGAWHHTARDDQPPAFAPLASRRFRAQANDADGLARLRGLGLRVWDDPDDAADLVAHLGDLLAATDIRPTAVGAFKNQYAAAWHEVAQRDNVDPFAGREGASLVTATQSSLKAVALGSPSGLIVVPCTAGHAVTERLELLGVTIVPVDPADGRAVVERLNSYLGDKVAASDAISVEVEVDGRPLADAEGEPLITAERDWLAALVIAALELAGSRFRRRGERGLREAAERLRSTRVVFAAEGQVITGLSEATHAIEASRPLAVDDATAPVIVAVHAPVWTWGLLEDLARPIAELLREPELGVAIGYALVRLQRDTEGADLRELGQASMNSALLASALNVAEHQVDQVRQSLRTSLAATLERLYPALCLLVGPEAAADFDPETLALEDRDAVLDALRVHAQPIVDATAMQPDALLGLAEGTSPLHEFVARVGLGFADFNGQLEALGPPYAPMRNVAGQAALFEEYVEIHRAGILDRLREAHLQAYRDFDDLSAYVEARPIAIEPDPGWVEACWEPEPSQMEERVARWLVDHGADPGVTAPCRLGPVGEVRDHNRRLLTGLVDEALPVLKAWSAKNGGKLPDPWVAKEPAHEVGGSARAAGFEDFEALHRPGALAWLAVIDCWPRSMPVTLDLDRLGLTQAEVEVAATTEEGDGKARTPPNISIGDREVVAGEAGYSALFRLVEESLGPDFLATPKAYASLSVVDPRPEKRRRPGGGRPITAGRESLPDEMKGSIGLVGEICALRWLQEKYALDSDDCWVSGYRNIVLGGEGGDDSLGYDFKVERPNGPPFLFEVKASTADATAIELTPGETEAAQAHRGTNEYRILLITHVLDPDNRELNVLPNPFAAAGRGLYELIGRGIRYRFDAQ